MNLDVDEPSWNKCKKVQITWQSPAEIRIQDVWRVGTGENSKEIEVQRNRIRRESETIYRTRQEIPFDPKELWDCEMDYDYSLTWKIPTEQPTDADRVETVELLWPPHHLRTVSGACQNQTLSCLLYC